jgi:hypothetical protein
MFKLALLPLIAASLSALLTWTAVKYLEMTNEHRTTAALHPRGRPYSTRMPVLQARR